jgi:hypothetical protein
MTAHFPDLVQAVTKPVPSQESEQSGICVRGIVTKPVPSQESEQSGICVRDIDFTAVILLLFCKLHVYIHVRSFQKVIK